MCMNGALTGTAKVTTAPVRIPTLLDLKRALLEFSAAEAGPDGHTFVVLQTAAAAIRTTATTASDFAYA